MDLTDLITSIFCTTDDFLRGKRLRQRGFAPTLCDSEVLTMEVVGEFLGYDTDAQLFGYFRAHHTAPR